MNFSDKTSVFRRSDDAAAGRDSYGSYNPDSRSGDDYGRVSYGARADAGASAGASGYGAASGNYGGDPYGNRPQGYGVSDSNLILNRYRPLGEVGSGGYGTVQLAWDTRIQRRVAVKRMPIPQQLQVGYQDSDVFNELSPSQIPGLEEARTAAMLSHTNIVQVYDFEVHAGAAYLIMEYVDGMTLEQLLQQAGDTFTLDMVTAVFDAVAGALELAHANQVLHLDIKPANILIDRQGQVKVADFGMARLSDAWGYSAASGGTIGYMPPEQMRQEPLDERCDEWALASVLYEMISGNNPFVAPTIPDAIAAIENAEIVIPSLCMEGLPSAADDVIFYALDPDRNERYASVSDFAGELTNYLGSEANGRAQLQTALGSYLSDDPADASPAAVADPSTGFSLLSEKLRGRFDLNGKVSDMSLRVCGLLIALAAAVAELPTFDVLGGSTSLLYMAAFAGMLAVGFAAPRFGALVDLALVVAALVVHGRYAPALIIGVLFVVWWGAAGQKDNAQADAGTLPFATGAVGLNQIAPLLAGFFLPVNEAVKNTLFAWVLAVILASFGSTSLLGWNVNLGTFANGSLEKGATAVLTDPASYVVLATWLAAAAVTSVFVRRNTRSTAVGGALLGGVVLLAGSMAVTGVASGFASWTPNVNYLVPAIISTAIVALLGWFYAPERSDS